MLNNKIPQQINDIAGDNVKLLEQLFPSAVKDGQVDFEALKEELGQFEEVNKEKYELTWSGKQNAKKLAQEDVYNKTLKYIEEDSKDPDTTENLYIEGDNLEVLKLLRRNYYGAIKMIYIDPPYNTGNDFVYNDNFKMDKIESDIAEGVVSEDNERLQKNVKSTNRYHANWLNMMYPRLKVARDLLTDDGVIFISIDDNEVENLKKICNEIFGEENFVACLIWNTDGHTDNQYDIKVTHEYILIYAQNKNCLEIGWVIDKNTRDESNLWKGYAENSITKNGSANPPSAITLKAGFPCEISKLQLSENIPKEEFWKEVKASGYITRQITEKYNVTYPIRMNKIIVEKNKLEEDTTLYTGWGNANKLKQFIDNDFLPINEQDGIVRFFLSKKGVVYYHKERTKARNITSVLRGLGTTEKMRSELEKENVFFSYPKPQELLMYLLQIGNINERDIMLDFFSGSATSAHAVLKLNAEDRGKRKYICVQLPEKIDEKSEAFKAGYPNICEIGKERIRSAGEKIKSEIEISNAQLKDGEEPKDIPDIGFKVFRTSDTNIKWNNITSLEQLDMKDMEYKPDLADFVLDSKDQDIVYEIMLRQHDVSLSDTMEVLTEIGERTYLYASSYLVCLETDITEKLVEKLSCMNPLPIKFVFRDSAFKDNIDLKDETFRRLKTLIKKNSGVSKKTYTVEFI